MSQDDHMVQQFVSEVHEPEPVIQQEQQQQQHQQIEITQHDSTQIYIQVSDPVEKGSGISKYTVYAIKGQDALGQFETYRRFSEFFILRETLLQNWPGCYIPPIPEKAMGSSPEQTQERVRLLNIFVMKMTQVHYLYYSEEFSQIFLRSSQVEIGKQLEKLPRISVTQLTEKYQNIFEVPEIKEPPSECLAKMNAVQAFLRKSQSLLGKSLEQTKQLSQARKGIRDQSHILFSQVLPEYERATLQDCVFSNKQMIFTNPAATEITASLTQIKDITQNPLDKLNDLITTEVRDLDAFLQAFTTRDLILTQKQKIESKLRDEQIELSSVMAGKPTIKGAFSKMTLEEQKQKLELQMMETQKEADQYKIFYQLVTFVLTYKQIDKFKKDKHDSYKLIISDLAKLELEQLHIQQEFWIKVTSLAEVQILDT